MNQSLIFISLKLLCVAVLSISSISQGWGENHVLSLDGDRSYVRLPSSLFNNLTEATVEGWVRWEKFSPWARFFDFGEIVKSMYVAREGDTNNLVFDFWDKDRNPYRIIAAGILSEGKWYHIAAVSGKGGMRLYVNGMLVGENPYDGSFSRIGSGASFNLGLSNWTPTQILHGQLDEVRVWNVARTEKQIQDTMYTTLRSDEPNLVGYWKFEAVGAQFIMSTKVEKQAFDSTKNQHHGELIGAVKQVAMELPRSVPKPAILSGIVLYEQGGPVSQAVISLRRDDEEVVTMQTDEQGRYQIVLLSFDQQYDLYATLQNIGELKAGISLREGEYRSLNLTLHEAVNISGQLWTLDNTSTHSGVLVQAIRGGKVVAFTISDELGKYHFVNLKPGYHQVRCITPMGASFKPAPTKDILVQRGKTVSGIDFRFAPFKKGIWTNFDQLDGLVSNAVNAIHMDKRGYLWIGTRAGISRFDGKEFVNYTTKDGLSDKGIRVIYEDKQGYLWFGTGDSSGVGSGIYRFDGKSFVNYTTKEGLADNAVGAIGEDKQGHLWFGTGGLGLYERESVGGGVSRFDGKKFVNYTTKDGLASNQVLAIYLDRQGNLWFGTNGGVSKYDGKRFVNYTTKDGLVDNYVRAICEDRQGNLWFGTGRWGSYEKAIIGGGVSRFDGKKFVNYTTKDGLVDNLVADIHLDRQGHLWFATGTGVAGTGRGVSRFDGEKFVNFTTQDGLLGRSVLAIEEDQYGHLWFGGGGISRLNEAGVINYAERDGLLGSNEMVRSIHMDRQGYLWFGTDGGGVSRFDGKEFTTYTAVDGLVDNRIWAIGEDQQGNLWFGSSIRGVSRYDGKNFIKYTAQDGFIGSWVLAIHKDRQGNLWISSGNGVSRYDSKNFINYTTKDGLARNSVWSIGEDKGGNLWFGTREGGVSRFGWEKFVTYTTEDGLGGNWIRAIHEDRNGFLWVATNGGISRSVYPVKDWKRDGKKFVTYTIEDGLPSNIVAAIHEDRRGHLWFGTEGGGVVHYDGVTFQSLDTRDGLIGNRVYDIDGSKDGFLWFATNKGVTRYRRDPTPPNAKITAVTTDKRYTDFSQIKPFTSGTRITIEYTSIDFKTHKDKRLYRYKLEGYNADWSKPTKATQVDYHKLKSGTHTFMVQAIDRDLNYSKSASLELKVVPPFYLRATFLIPTLGLGTILLAVSIISTTAFVKHRRQVLAYQRAAVEELQDARQMQLSLLPASAPTLEGVEIASKCISANTVGGDFFDYLTSKTKNQIAIVIADVTGKGLKGAMNAVMTDGILRLAAKEKDRLSPVSLLMELNDVLKDSMERDMNVTMVIGLIDAEKKTLTLANAGHHIHPIFIRNGELEFLKAKGLPLGMKSGIEYAQSQFQLEAGNVAVFMTDGITEARDVEGRLYLESGRLEKMLSQFSGDMSAEAMVESIINDVIAFGREKTGRDDDMTVVVLKVNQ